MAEYAAAGAGALAARFEIRIDERQLLVDGQAVALGSRAFDLIVVLAERRDRVVSKNELMELVWPGVVVEENNLQVQISSLRKLLGPQAIATVPGRGYRFTATAAAAGAPSASAATEAMPADAAPAPRAPRTAGDEARLLVADDNKVNRLLLCRTLELQGHRVASVDNGRQALDALRRDHFDLLLLDLEMPELDGFALLEKLRADPELRELPVIVTSSLEGVAQVARCIELGAEDYLRKPVNPVLLKARVGNCLEKRRLRDEQRALVARLAARADAQAGNGGTAPAARRADATVLQARLLAIGAIASAAPADETIELLGAWTTLMCEAVEGQGGMVSEFGGDTLLAVFGMPLPSRHPADTPLAAVRAALDMVELVELFNAERAAANKQTVAVAVGIASGDVVAGCAGTPRRSAYACVGETVERAARLLTLAASGEQPLLIDAATHAELRGRVATEALPLPAEPGWHAVKT